MKTFLEHIVSDLIERKGLDRLGECTMVFPMQRAGLFVKQAILAHIRQTGYDKPVVLPHMTTIDMLADSLSDLHAEDEMVAICRLYQAYQKHTKETLTPDAFYGWGNQLMTDFSNSDMGLLDVREMMQTTAESAELDQLELDDDVRERLLHLLGSNGTEKSVRRYYTSLWKALPDIYDTFTQAQAEVGVGTRGARTRWVIEHFEDEKIQQKTAGRCYVFVGFNYLLAAERELMRLLRAHGETLFYWDYNPNFHTDESIYKFLREDVREFGGEAPLRLSPEGEGLCSEGEKKKVTAIACPSSAAEAQYVHQWLKAHHHEGEKTAVVLADESLLQSVIYSLPRKQEGACFERVNVTKGYPLRNTHIYAHAVEEMEREAYEDMAPDQLLRTLITHTEAYYKNASRAEENSWQQVLTDEAYYQTQLVLRDLEVLLEKEPMVKALIHSSRLLRNVIRRRLEAVSIPFHGEPITDIQIIGVLETRLLDFDNVLILNVEEGVVPNTGADHSFIPYDLRRAHGMQTRDEEAKIYGYNFFRLMQRAKHVTLTFSEAGTDMGQKTMSRFVMQMLTSDEFEVEKHRLTEDSTVATEEVEECRMQPDDLRPNHLSPSAISDYIECPKEFYLKHIRKIYPAEEETVFFEPSTLGTLVHAVLESAYTQMKTAAAPDWTLALSEAYTAANEKYRQHHPDCDTDPYVSKDHEVENHAIVQMARRVVEWDKKTGEVEIIWLEKPVKMTIAGLTLMGVIDRLDKVKGQNENDGQNENEYVRILDYKTGGYRAEKMQVNNMDELFSDPNKRYALQTLIYCELLRHQEDAPYPSLPICPELFYTKQPSEERRLLLPNGEGVKGYHPLTNYVTEIAEQFEPRLNEMIGTIMTAETYPMAEREQCEDSHCYCPFHLLCGRQKKSADY